MIGRKTNAPEKNRLAGGSASFRSTRETNRTRVDDRTDDGLLRGSHIQSPMIRAVDHINIVVADLERSVRFYTDVLGFRKTKEAYLEGEWIDRIVGLRGVKGRAAFVVAPAGEPRIELLCYETPRGISPVENGRANTIGLRHIALRVDDMAATVARLRAANVTIFSEPVRVPDGVVKHDAGEKTLVYFLDPDGVILELAEYR
jgi:catechol 2,3-dioxygenase-like lactoylglutathione lyase family enzyme